MGLSSPIFLLDIITFAAAIAMFLTALRAHYLVRKRGTYAFVATFALIALGIFIRLAIDGVIGVLPLTRAMTGINDFALLYKAGLLLAYFFVLAGYTLLLLVIEHVNKTSMWILVFMLIVFTLVLAGQQAFVADFVASIILLLLVWRLLVNYVIRKNTNSLLVFAAFLLLAVSHLSKLIFIGDFGNLIFLIARLAGFFILFVVSWRILRK